MRYTFISDGYAAVNNDSCYEDQNEDYCGDAIDKLAAYEDADEQGRLVILPCKVGDTIYRIVRHRVDVSGYRMEWEWETAVEAVTFRIGMADAFGKTVFLTRAEAEAALKGETQDV